MKSSTLVACMRVVFTLMTIGAWTAALLRPDTELNSRLALGSVMTMMIGYGWALCEIGCTALDDD